MDAAVGGLGSHPGGREHVGRRSGKRYRIPVVVFDTRDGLAIMLPYGPNRDWIRNLSAAGRARVQRYGKTFPVTNPPYRG